LRGLKGRFKEQTGINNVSKLLRVRVAKLILKYAISNNNASYGFAFSFDVNSKLENRAKPAYITIVKGYPVDT